MPCWCGQRMGLSCCLSVFLWHSDSSFYFFFIFCTLFAAITLLALFLIQPKACSPFPRLPRKSSLFHLTVLWSPLGSAVPCLREWGKIASSPHPLVLCVLPSIVFWGSKQEIRLCLLQPFLCQQRLSPGPMVSAQLCLYLTNCLYPSQYAWHGPCGRSLLSNTNGKKRRSLSRRLLHIES